MLSPAGDRSRYFPLNGETSQKWFVLSMRYVKCRSFLMKSCNTSQQFTVAVCQFNRYRKLYFVHVFKFKKEPNWHRFFQNFIKMFTIKWSNFRIKIAFFFVFLRYLCQFLVYRKTKNGVCLSCHSLSNGVVSFF